MMGTNGGKNWTEIRIWVLTLGLVCSFGLGGYAVNRGVDKEEATKILAGYADELRDDKVKLCDDPTNVSKPECNDPVPPEVQDVVPDQSLPSPLPTVQGKQGERGPGPTYAQVLAVTLDILPGIAKRLCANNGCAKDGKDGKDAPPPTSEQIAAAVNTAIDEALARNCGGSCKADPPADGKDGRGITSIDCAQFPALPRQRFTITYTDGTQQVVRCNEDSSIPQE